MVGWEIGESLIISFAGDGGPTFAAEDSFLLLEGLDSTSPHLSGLGGGLGLGIASSPALLGREGRCYDEGGELIIIRS